MPPEAAWLMRSRAGGLGRLLRAKRDQAAALAEREAGSGLARLAADQLAHARQLHEQGDTRKSDAYVAVRNTKGDVRALLQTAEAAAARFREAGLRVEPLRDRALAQAIAESWQPQVTEHWVWNYESEDGEAFGLAYSPGWARVVEPRYVEAVPGGAPPAAPSALTAGSPGAPGSPRPNGHLPGPPNGKALPR